MGKSRLKRPRGRQAGFSLVELMIVAAIIGILVALALPRYQEYLRQTHRASAQAVLLEAAQFMERFFTQHHRYDQTAATPPVAVALPADLRQVPPGAAQPRYNISFVDGSLTRNTFTLQAEPTFADEGCGIMTINQLGVRTSAGTHPLERCWR